MSTISLLYDGYEIIQDTIIADAVFESQADGRAGTCSFRVKDAGNIDGDYYGFPSNRIPPGTFKTGLVIELRIDDVLVWSGVTQNVTRAYAFEAENTLADPNAHQRYWLVEGVDWNILFNKRVVWNQAEPTVRVPAFTGAENDGDVVKLIMDSYMDLSGDGISQAGVTTVGPLSPYGEPFNAANVGDAWVSVMDRITASNGAIYYIDPDKVLQYRDAEIITAPFVLSDQPQVDDNSIGYRDMAVSSSATEMANDALVWGVGGGSPSAVFARIEDATSIAEHGRLQWGDYRSDMWLTQSVERRAESYIYGSPTSRRGHKDDHDQIAVTIFEPTFRVGQVVDFRNNTFGYQDDVPIRQMRITFPTPTDAMFELQLSHKIDLPLFIVDPPPTWPSPPPIDDGWITEMFPVPVASPGYTLWEQGDEPFGGDNIFQDIHRFISVNEDGQFVGSGGGVYASVGIKNGFASNIPWPQSICNSVGPGAWNKYEYREQWQKLVDPAFREFLVAAHFDYEVNIGSFDVTGYVPSIVVRIAHGDPAVGRFGDGTVIAVIANPEPEPPEPMLFGARTVDFGSVIVPIGLLDTPDSCWLVIAPGWESERGGYYCDPFYTEGPAHPCAGAGPRCSGQGSSGVIALTAFSSSSVVAYNAQSGTSTTGGVRYTGSDGASTFYRTQYPYISGTLTVTYQGVVLTDAAETDPPRGMFSLPLDLHDQGQYITVTYRRSDIVTTQPPPYTGETPPGEPDSDIDPGSPTGNAVEAVIREAFEMLGTPYVLGAESRSATDCSGLIFRIFTDSGWGQLIGNDRKLAAGYTRFFANQGRFTRNLNNARRGDLISYSENGTRVSHIGIYLGNGYTISACVPPYGVIRHRTTSIGVPFYGVCLVPYPADSRTGGDSAPGSDDDPEDTQSPTETPPQQTETRSTYRPQAQRQYGWGTVYDGSNCNMACAAMALDRHTLGAFTQTRGEPLNTPPNQRVYSGSTSLVGTTHEDTTTAWSAGWGKTWSNPGPISWATFVANIQSGRGATIFGLYSAMDDTYKKSQTFDGAHALYINEQLGDGSFWGFDPLVGYPIVYPYSVLRTYAESYYGPSTGRVSAGFTRVTPYV